MYFNVYVSTSPPSPTFPVSDPSTALQNRKFLSFLMISFSFLLPLGVKGWGDPVRVYSYGVCFVTSEICSYVCFVYFVLLVIS